MVVCVLGAAGRVGRIVSSHVYAAGHAVRGVVHRLDTARVVLNLRRGDGSRRPDHHPGRRGRPGRRRARRAVPGLRSGRQRHRLPRARPRRSRRRPRRDRHGHPGDGDGRGPPAHPPVVHVRPPCRQRPGRVRARLGGETEHRGRRQGLRPGLDDRPGRTPRRLRRRGPAVTRGPPRHPEPVGGGRVESPLLHGVGVLGEGGVVLDPVSREDIAAVIGSCIAIKETTGHDFDVTGGTTYLLTALDVLTGRRPRSTR